MLFGGWPRTAGKMAKTTTDELQMGSRGGANWKHAHLEADAWGGSYKLKVQEPC